jgi:signal transduction histidine kinase
LLTEKILWSHTFGKSAGEPSVFNSKLVMKPEALPKLFQKFSRAEDASKANILGTGLGLYVARLLIEAQKGKVWAESEGEGMGATFFVELPTL